MYNIYKDRGYIMARARMIIWYILSFLYFIISYPVIFYARYLHLNKRYARRDWFANNIVSHIAKLMFYMSGSRVKLKGTENIPKDKPVVFVSNHQGHMDSVIIQSFIKKPKGFVAIKEYERFPIVGSWMTYMGSVFVDRGDMHQTFLNINQAVDNLNRGQSMVVFPEGKLNDGGQTFAFERGWLRLVTKTKVPIIPITIKGSHKILSYNGRTMRPSRIECIISEPIETYDLKRQNEQEFLKNLRNTILEHI